MGLTFQVRSLATVPSMVGRLKHHLQQSNQPYDTLTTSMHLLSVIATALSAYRTSGAVYMVLRTLFDPSMAKLLSATVGVKCAPLSQQVCFS